MEGRQRKKRLVISWSVRILSANFSKCARNILLAWETYEHHLALMKREGYPDIIGLAPVFGEGDPKLYHVDFIESPETALAQNATEILIMTLKEGKTKEDLAAAIAVLGAKITAEDGCSKPLAWGETREEPGKTFFSFLGWESSKVGWPS
jgi:hypothetical protein